MKPSSDSSWSHAKDHWWGTQEAHQRVPALGWRVHTKKNPGGLVDIVVGPSKLLTNSEKAADAQRQSWDKTLWHAPPNSMHLSRSVKLKSQAVKLNSFGDSPSRVPSHYSHYSRAFASSDGLQPRSDGLQPSRAFVGWSALTLVQRQQVHEQWAYKEVSRTWRESKVQSCLIFRLILDFRHSTIFCNKDLFDFILVYRLVIWTGKELAT